ncbi:MAG TPA: hypothetical protein VFK05_21950 [Polyangiaceae bacterium]|nr:hypothetical protein [Polyangiaceae bacterium]
MSRTIRSAVRAPKGIAWRAHWLRGFALLLTLLGLLAQQRAVSHTLRPNASVVRQVAERVQSRETHAVRAQPALRVAPAPILSREPWFPEHSLARAFRDVRVHAALAPPAADPSHAPLSHFHGTRRIPRMNSEEPPRA